MMHVDRVMGHERVVVWLERGIRSFGVRAEQMSVSWMKELLAKFIKGAREGIWL